MPPFLYRCPSTGQTVQGFTAEEVPGAEDAVWANASRLIRNDKVAARLLCPAP